jgi:hypothetical protein
VPFAVVSARGQARSWWRLDGHPLSVCQRMRDAMMHEEGRVQPVVARVEAVGWPVPRTLQVSGRIGWASNARVHRDPVCDELEKGGDGTHCWTVSQGNVSFQRGQGISKNFPLYVTPGLRSRANASQLWPHSSCVNASKASLL